MPASAEARWLLLIHQVPPKPNYFRVKVYALPRTDQTYEDFEWVMREIVEGGGEASICEARFVEGLSDEQVEALFHAARDADYGQLCATTTEWVDVSVGQQVEGMVEVFGNFTSGDLVAIRSTDEIRRGTKVVHHEHSHGERLPAQWHTHEHAHTAVTHTHDHAPDLHHRHEH